MLVCPFSGLACALGLLVSAFAVSVCGWAGASLAVKVLGCELGRLVFIFSVLVFPFGMLVSAFTVSGLG